MAADNVDMNFIVPSWDWRDRRLFYSEAFEFTAGIDNRGAPTL